MSDRQYAFRDGHFVDTWNPGEDDTCPPLEPFAWWEMILTDAGLCGCSDHALIGAAMTAYLEVGVRGGRNERHAGEWLARLAWELLAGLADRAGFTEHGTSLAGAFLTPAGERWLQLWREAHPGMPTAPESPP